VGSIKLFDYPLGLSLTPPELEPLGLIVDDDGKLSLKRLANVPLAYPN